MMSLRQFVQNAEQLVQQTQLNMALKLQRGSITGMEEYMRQVGRAEGLDQCVTLLKDMLGKVEDMERNKNLEEMPQEAPE
jgi:hypothetical protein